MKMLTGLSFNNLEVAQKLGMELPEDIQNMNLRSIAFDVGFRICVTHCNVKVSSRYTYNARRLWTNVNTATRKSPVVHILTLFTQSMDSASLSTVALSRGQMMSKGFKILT